MKWIALVPVALASGLAVVACSATEPVSADPGVVGSGNPADVAAQGGRDSGTTTTTSSGGGAFGDDPTCSRSLVAIDSAALPVCGGGKGHCYDKDKTPSAVTLDECDATHWCVPNAVFAAGKLKSCNSGMGPGACASTLIHEVAARAGDLSPTGCDEGDLCVPCATANGQATFACGEIGLYDKVCAPGTEVDSGLPGPPPDAGPPPPVVLDECCPNVDFAGNALPSGGTCIPNGQLPAEQSNLLEQKTCIQNFTCAPTELYNGGQGNGAFTSCEWDADWSFGGNGVCIDNCFLTAAQHAELNDNGVESDGCGPTKRCVPCGDGGVPESTPGCF